MHAFTRGQRQDFLLLHGVMGVGDVSPAHAVMHAEGTFFIQDAGQEAGQVVYDLVPLQCTQVVLQVQL